MATKATIAASRMRFIEVALAKLEGELKNAEGSDKETLQKWIADMPQTLRKLGRHTMH